MICYSNATITIHQLWINIPYLIRLPVQPQSSVVSFVIRLHLILINIKILFDMTQSEIQSLEPNNSKFRLRSSRPQQCPSDHSHQFPNGVGSEHPTRNPKLNVSHSMGYCHFNFMQTCFHFCLQRINQLMHGSGPANIALQNNYLAHKYLNTKYTQLFSAESIFLRYEKISIQQQTKVALLFLQMRTPMLMWYQSQHRNKVFGYSQKTTFCNPRYLSSLAFWVMVQTSYILIHPSLVQQMTGTHAMLALLLPRLEADRPMEHEQCILPYRYCTQSTITFVMSCHES